jgi:hypothetical protein
LRLKSSDFLREIGSTWADFCRFLVDFEPKAGFWPVIARGETANMFWESRKFL